MRHEILAAKERKEREGTEEILCVLCDLLWAFVGNFVGNFVEFAQVRKSEFWDKL